MKIEVRKEPIATLDEYASIPILFEVSSILDVTASADGLGEFVLTEQPLDVPYVKDYDSINDAEPAQWPKRFDMSNWALFVARSEAGRVGGAVVAFSTPGLVMLDGREDLAVLWDIRVSPAARRKGVGSSLLRVAEAWAQTRGCRQLKVETQNIIVGACRFYARQGCVLRAVNRMAYDEFPNEVQLLWYKDLSENLSSN